jgi:endonuclease YncB( thermonuclease family)
VQVARPLVFVFALAAWAPSFCQETGKPPINFPDNETCGTPLMESQLWQGVTGIVKEVTAPTTIRIFVSDPTPHVLTVRLVGVRSPAGRRSSKNAISFLRRATEGREVTVLLNPSDKYFELRKTRRVDGWLGSVSSPMIESGIAEYEPPKAYRMSQYDACQLKLAEKRAKMARVGIWGGSGSQQ